MAGSAASQPTITEHPDDRQEVGGGPGEGLGREVLVLSTSRFSRLTSSPVGFPWW